MRLLLVEDDESIREVLKLILETDSPVPSLIVDTAADGREALEKARTTRPDLILLDLTLPEEHGFEVFKKIRALENCGTVPVVAVSAHAARTMQQEALDIGFSAYVSKPIDFEGALFPVLRQFSKTPAHEVA